LQAALVDALPVAEHRDATLAFPRRSNSSAPERVVLTALRERSISKVWSQTWGALEHRGRSPLRALLRGPHGPESIPRWLSAEPKPHDRLAEKH
jgi:hypothetical protein